jgi:hypothetical protein
MSFFRKSRTHSPEKLVKMVETVLQEVGLDPVACRNEEGPEDQPHLAWNFQLPSGTTDLFLILRPSDEGLVLEVRSLVVQMPRQNLMPFYRRLLELNSDEVSGAAFGIHGDLVVLTVDRPTDDLDPSEVTRMISAVVAATEHYSRELSAEFGCQPPNDYCE